MTKVLYIEDTESIQRMYSYGLEREGFNVTVAGTAGEALARIAETSFDVILLDLMLSGMSGLDFLKASELKTKSPHTKIIVLTNLDNPAIKQKLEDYGINGYLTKSMYVPSQLADYLKKLK